MKYEIGSSVKAISVNKCDVRHGLKLGDIGIVKSISGSRVHNVLFNRELRKTYGSSNLNSDGTYQMFDTQLELVKEEKEMNGNFKVIAVNNYGKWFKLGKIYECKNGHMTYEDGFTGSMTYYPDFETWKDVNDNLASYVKEYISDTTQTITINRNGRHVIATLTENGKVINTAKATCNPSDTFKFEIGRNLAVKRLLGEFDVKGIEAVQKDIPLTAKGFKVGDKVKLKNNMSDGIRYGKLTFLSGMLFDGVATVIRITQNGNFDIDKKSYHYSTEMLELVTEPIIIDQPSFDWSAFKQGKFAVHCDTKEKARGFLKECIEQSLLWCSCELIDSNETEWLTNEENTCYACDEDGVFFGNIDRMTKKFKLQIIDYAKPSPIKKVNRNAVKGEYIKALNDQGGFIHRDTVYKVEIVGDDSVYVKDPTGEYTTTNSISHDNYIILENYNPIKKVKRPAKVGEWIKVTSVNDPNHKGRYELGDILRVTNDCNEIGSTWRNTGVVYYHPKCDIYVIRNTDYVVLENYQPEEPKPMLSSVDVKAFVKAKVGDKIKVVKDMGGHGTNVKVGEMLEIDRVDDDGVHDNDRAFLWDSDEEYIIIEEAPIKSIEPTKPEVVKQPKVGDKIKIVKLFGDDRFKIGEVYEVMGVREQDVFVKHPRGMQYGTGWAVIYDSEKYVAIEDINPLSTYTQEELMRELFNRQGL